MADGCVIGSSVWPLSQGVDDDDKQPVGGTLWMSTILSHPFYFHTHTHTHTYPYHPVGTSSSRGGQFCAGRFLLSDRHKAKGRERRMEQLGDVEVGGGVTVVGCSWSGGYNLRGDDGRLNISKSSSFLQNCESYFNFIPLFFSILLSVGVCGGIFLQLSPTLSLRTLIEIIKIYTCYWPRSRGEVNTYIVVGWLIVDDDAIFSYRRSWSSRPCWPRRDRQRSAYRG